MPPSSPNLTISQDQVRYGLVLNITNPEPVVRNNVYRRTSHDSYELIGSTEGQSNNYIDYEAASGTMYTYKVEAVASDDTTADSSEVSASITIPMWIMKDLDEIEDTIFPFIDNDPLSIESEESQATFNPIGRKYPLVIKDDEVKGAKFDINMQFTSEEGFRAFEKLRAKQKILLLQSPMPGRQWYFVFASQGRERVMNTNDPYRHFDIGLIEVGRP